MSGPPEDHEKFVLRVSGVAVRSMRKSEMEGIRTALRNRLCD